MIDELSQESLLSGLQGRVFIKNRDLEFTYCNDALARDLGISPHEIIGTDDFRYFPEDLAINNRVEDRHVIETGRSLNHVKKHWCRGREIWVRVSKEPYFDGEGRVIGVLGLLEDIPCEQSCWGIGSPADIRDDRGESQIPVIVWEWEIGTDSFTLSGNAEALLGERIPLNRGPGFHPADIVYEEDRERAVSEVRRAIKDKRFFSMELRIPMRRSVKWFHTTGGLIISRHDGKTRLYGIARDISEWKESRISFNSYRSAYEVSSVPKLFMDTEGNLIHCNSAFLELWRIHSSRELHGYRVHDFWVKDSELDKAIRDGLKENRCWQGEMDALRPDGSVFRCSVTLHELTDDNGNPLNITATVQDMTERKALIEDNRTLADQFERVLQTTQDGFWIIDREGFFKDVNDNACRMLGYTREQILTLHVRDVDTLESGDDMITWMARIREQGSLQFKTRHKTRGGEILDVEVSAIYWPGDDSFFAFTKNVSERESLMKDLIRTKKNLEETNTALKIVLSNREKESADSSQSISRILQKTVMPLLYQLKMENDSHSEKIIDQVIQNLQGLQNGGKDELADKLSPREYQVARYIVQSLSSKEIADLMGMSIRTVESYRLTIRRKLDLSNTHRNLRSELESLLM